VPDRPLLNLPAPTAIDLPQKHGGGAAISRPSRDRQRERIDPRFERLSAVAETPAQLMALRDDPASIAPERAIVFEVEGSLKDFYDQARSIGLEYLGDFEEEFDPSDDFFVEEKPDQKVSGRIYLAMPDVQALRELLSLWERYKQNRRMPKGRSEWRVLFSQLIDVRPWGPQDRVSSDAIAAWEDDLARDPDALVRLEIELWYHENAEKRTQAFQALERDIADAGGQVVHHAVIPEIHYDAALIDLPGASIRALIDNPAVSLARADEVMFLRPQSVARYPSATEFTGGDSAAVAADADQAEPIAALLDGFPIQNHVRLAGRLDVDDPEGLDAIYPVARREHGTEMASLIIHGDLNAGEPPLPRRLYVRPVMRPHVNGDERTPPDRLLVDVIHQAVRRIKEGDGAQPAVAPGVVVINLSLGDETRPYARTMSPLSRLLDYLSNRYRVLFLVSAGNILDRLPVAAFDTSIEFEAATPVERERAILEALNSNKSRRTLLSPAESLNALTIGAAHSGSAFNGNLPNGRTDPFTDEELPNIVSAMGLGFKKIVKPELLFSGGRAPVSVVASGGGIVIAPVTAGVHMFGLKAARPSPQIGGTRYEDFTFGTSVATALATRGAHQIHDVLIDGNGGSNHTDIDAAHMPLVLKALLVHGAQWGAKGQMLDDTFQPQGTGSHFSRRDDIARLLGYGVPNIDRVLDCTENRATLLGVGSIAPESSLLYRVPLPDGLDGVRALRAITITLGWFSPVNPRHQGYRMAALDVASGSDQKFWIAPLRSLQPTDKATARGTVFHERRTGEAASVFVDDGHLLLRLTCRAAAGNLADNVPYALAISMEVGVETGIPVYEQVRVRLAQAVPAAITP
jgi:Subtilase family